MRSLEVHVLSLLGISLYIACVCLCSDQYIAGIAVIDEIQMLHPWTLDSSIVRGTIDPSDAIAAVRNGTAREHLDAALVSNLARMLLIERWALSSTCESIVLQMCGMRVPGC